MKYELIGQNDYLINPVKTILTNRGIDDIDKFLNIDKSVTYDYNLLKNINEAVDCLLTHLENDDIIYVQVDCDGDGVTSAALFYNYIKLVFPSAKIIYGLPTGKEHGVNVENVPDEVKLVVIPDAGSDQFKEHKQLKNKGMNVIVLDHHKVDRLSDDAIVVNNKACDYPNEELSGVGVVYKFCQALDDKLNVKHADKFLDLVAVGNIADVVDLKSLETRYYVLKGLENINNPLIKELCKKQEFSTKGIINIINIGFYIAPLINACLRFGSQEEKDMMFKALIHSDETVKYKKRGTTTEIDQPIAEASARICANIKARQDKARDKALDNILERIAEKNLDQNKILIVDVTEILDKTLSGLVANQLANKFKRPVLLLRYNEKDNVYGGSGRGYDKSTVKRFDNFLLNTGKFDWVAGHDNAFGFSVSADNIIEVNSMINEQLKDVEFEDVFDVDFVIPYADLNIKVIESIASLADLWGNKVNEPKIAITDINIDSKSIELMGSKRNTIKFKTKNIEFIQFRTTEDRYNELTKDALVNIEIVGKCSVNEYEGNKTAQIIIDDYNILKSKKFLF